MLHIILMILKIIGIILLILFALVLLIILSILFVPIRYKSNGEISKDNVNLKFQVGWFGILKFRGSLINGQLRYKVNILFKTIITSDSQVNNTSEEEASNKVTSDKMTSKKQVDNKSTSKKRPIDIVDKETKIHESREKSRDSIEDKEVFIQSVDETINEHEEKISILTKVKKIIIGKFTKIKFKIRKFCDKLKQIRKRKQEYIDFLTADESKKAIKKLKILVIKAIKHIFPTKIEAKIRFGFEDPSTTGMVLGFASILYPLHKGRVELISEFEKEVFEGWYKLKGRIRLVTLLLIALKIYKQKRLRQFINFVKQKGVL